MKAQRNKNVRKETARHRAPNGQYKKAAAQGTDGVELAVDVKVSVPNTVYYLLLGLVVVVGALAYSSYSHADEVPVEAEVKAEVQVETVPTLVESISYVTGMSVALDKNGDPVGRISTRRATAKVYPDSLSSSDTRILMDNVAACLDGTTFGNMVEMRDCLSRVDGITYDVYKTGFMDRLRTWW